MNPSRRANALGRAPLGVLLLAPRPAAAEPLHVEGVIDEQIVVVDLDDRESSSRDLVRTPSEVAQLTAGGRILLRDPASLEVTARIWGPAPFTAVAVGPDGRLVAATSEGELFRVEGGRLDAMGAVDGVPWFLGFVGTELAVGAWVGDHKELRVGSRRIRLPRVRPFGVPGSYLADDQGRLWLGSYFGEWGGAVYRLPPGRTRPERVASIETAGVVGFASIAGQIWALGGQSGLYQAAWLGRVEPDGLVELYASDISMSVDQEAPSPSALVHAAAAVDDDVLVVTQRRWFHTTPTVDHWMPDDRFVPTFDQVATAHDARTVVLDTVVAVITEPGGWILATAAGGLIRLPVAGPIVRIAPPAWERPVAVVGGLAPGPGGPIVVGEQAAVWSGTWQVLPEPGANPLWRAGPSTAVALPRHPGQAHVAVLDAVPPRVVRVPLIGDTWGEWQGDAWVERGPAPDHVDALVGVRGRPDLVLDPRERVLYRVPAGDGAWTALDEDTVAATTLPDGTLVTVRDGALRVDGGSPPHALTVRSPRGARALAVDGCGRLWAGGDTLSWWDGAWHAVTLSGLPRLGWEMLAPMPEGVAGSDGQTVSVVGVACDDAVHDGGSAAVRPDDSAKRAGTYSSQPTSTHSP